MFFSFLIFLWYISYGNFLIKISYISFLIIDIKGLGTICSGVKSVNLIELN